MHDKLLGQDAFASQTYLQECKLSRCKPSLCFHLATWCLLTFLNSVPLASAATGPFLFAKQSALLPFSAVKLFRQESGAFMALYAV